MGSWTSKAKADEGGGEFKKIDLEVDESFEGRYSGPRTVNGANGEFISHGFQKDDDDNTEYTITGYALNRDLAGVEPGTLTRITFRGLVTTKAKRTVKTYDVEVYAEEAAAGAKSGKSF